MTGQSQLKSAQDALKACEERFRLIYEKAPVPYLMLDGNGCILSVNPAWENLLGYLKSEVMGASFYDMLPLQMRKDSAPIFRPSTPRENP